MIRLPIAPADREQAEQAERDRAETVHRAARALRGALGLHEGTVFVPVHPDAIPDPETGPVTVRLVGTPNPDIAELLFTTLHPRKRALVSWPTAAVIIVCVVCVTAIIGFVLACVHASITYDDAPTTTKDERQ